MKLLFFIAFSLFSLGSLAIGFKLVPDKDSEKALERPSRIINGAEAAAHELPYQVGLMSYGYGYCGAALVDEYLALTAAHCVKDRKESEIIVVAGVNDLQDTNAEKFKVEEIIMADYDPDSKKNDIALLKLKEIPGTGNRKSIRMSKSLELPKEKLNVTGRDCIVSGWGKTAGGITPRKLMKATVKMRSQAECKRLYDEYRDNLPWDADDDTMLCAGAEDTDACQGDSGGPLACPKSETDSTLVLVGVVSWGVGCATPKVPGAYARVDKYVDWINEKMGVSAGK